MFHFANIFIRVCEDCQKGNRCLIVVIQPFLDTVVARKRKQNQTNNTRAKKLNRPDANLG